MLPIAMDMENIHIGIIAGKLNGVIPAVTPKRLPHGVHVDPRSCGVGVFALRQVRDPARELDHFQAALNVTVTVRDHFAVL